MRPNVLGSHIATHYAAGISGATAVPLLHLPSHTASPIDSQRLALPSSRQSSSAHTLTSSSSASAADEAAASPASALRASRGSLVMQPLSESVLSELSSQQSGPQPAALKHASLSWTAFGRGLEQQTAFGEDDHQRGNATSSAPCGKRRKKKSRHAADPAMKHVEDHLQILKHVHIKHASPR